MSNGNQQGVGAPARKGLHPLAWIAIGCGGLIVVGVVVAMVLGIFAAKKLGEVGDNPAKAAEWFIKMNPDLELVEHDESAGTMTVRQESTGETVTVNYEDLKEGRLSFESDEGKVSFDASQADGGGLTVKTDEGTTTFGAAANLDDVPDWVILYPGATSTKPGMMADMAGTVSGSLQLTTDDDVEQVLAFYKKELEGQGYMVHQTITSSVEGPMGVVVGVDEAAGRTHNTNVMVDDGQTQIIVHYTQE